MLSQNPNSWGSWTHEQTDTSATHQFEAERVDYGMYPPEWAPRLGEVQPPKPTPEQMAQNPVVQMAVEASMQV